MVIADMDWQELYSFASKQALLGLCFEGIERLGKASLLLGFRLCDIFYTTDPPYLPSAPLYIASRKQSMYNQKKIRNILLLY